MNNKTHKIGGTCLGIISSTILFSNEFTFEGLLSSGLIISGSLIGSLAPDIDHPESKVGRVLILRPISLLINKIFGHRTLTHSVIMSILMFVLLLISTNMFGDGLFAFIYTNFIIGFCVGWTSHLLLDVITVKGIAMFYPFIKKKYNILKFKTNKDEDLVSTITMLLTGVLMIIYFRGK